MPKAEELPPPPGLYQEIETAKLHGGWAAWEKLPGWRREQLMAHELHKSRRDAYYGERIRAHAKRTKKPAAQPQFDPLEAIKASWGMKY